MNYYVISRPRAEADVFFRSARARAFEQSTPARLAQRSGGQALAPAAAGAAAAAPAVDLFEEVATIARPPVEPGSRKRPSTESTGYVLCVYRVFRGDDGEKFERNWLYWTGERDREREREQQLNPECQFGFPLFFLTSYLRFGFLRTWPP